MKNTRKGFIGLLVLLITSVLMIYFAWKVMPNFSPSSTSSTDDSLRRSESGQFEAINQANKAKNALEQKWANTINN